MSSALWWVLNGPGRGAAGALLERRPLHLEVAAGGEHPAHRLHDPAAGHEPVAHPLAVDQVEIPHPLLEVGIDEAVELVGGRLQRLREELEARGEDRHLAGLRLAEPAVDADEVAEVEAVDDLPGLGADLLLAEHDLDPAGAVVRGR